MREYTYRAGKALLDVERCIDLSNKIAICLSMIHGRVFIPKASVSIGSGEVLYTNGRADLVLEKTSVGYIKFDSPDSSDRMFFDPWIKSCLGPERCDLSNVPVDTLVKMMVECHIFLKRMDEILDGMRSFIDDLVSSQVHPLIGERAVLYLTDKYVNHEVACKYVEDSELSYERNITYSLFKWKREEEG